MISRPTLEQLKELERLTPAQRRTVFDNPYSTLLFFSYYFHDFVKVPFAPFHLDWAQDIGDLVTGKIKELAWITSRDTAKSSFAMCFTVQAVCNGWFHYINTDAYERDNSERALYEVVNNLQTNARIRFDYGELFNAPKNNQEKTQKRISDFVTTSGIRCESHTTGEPVRGRRHKEHRPDLIIMDDFENLSVIRSEAATKEVAEHIAEFKGGIEQGKGRILYLANRLSEDGNVAKIIERAKTDPNLRVRTTWILDDDGKPSWPERHVLTDDELRMNPEKVSIESLRRSMRDPDTGDMDFDREFLGIVIDPFGDGPDKQGYLPLFPQDTFHQRITDRPFEKQLPIALGVDPSGDGDDRTVVAKRTAFMAAVHSSEAKSTGKSVASLTIKAMDELKAPASAVVVDAFGVGFKATQELSLLGHRVKAVNVGELEVCDSELYANDRAYMYFMLRDWLQQGGLICEYPKLREQLKSIRFRVDEKGRRSIMPKREIKKRGYKSPDELDAIAMTFLTPLGGIKRRIKSSGTYDQFSVI